jgi:hypothetical protein
MWKKTGKRVIVSITNGEYKWALIETDGVNVRLVNE